MEVDQLTSIRIKEINAPILKDKVINSNIPREIINFTDEIEKIYSFLFIFREKVGVLTRSQKKRAPNTKLSDLEEEIRGKSKNPKK